MACGLPQVVYNAGALPELVKDGQDGFVVKDDVDFIKVLKYLLDSPELRKTMGNNAYHSVRSKFSGEAFAKRLKWIIKLALEKPITKDSLR